MKTEILHAGNKLVDKLDRMNEHLARVKERLNRCEKENNYEIFLSETTGGSSNYTIRLYIPNSEIKMYMNIYVQKIELDIKAFEKELEDL